MIVKGLVENMPLSATLVGIQCGIERTPFGEGDFVKDGYLFHYIFNNDIRLKPTRIETYEGKSVTFIIGACYDGAAFSKIMGELSLPFGTMIQWETI